MPRIRIELPDNFIFSTEIPVRISDINYGNHLGHDSYLSITHEARVRFFNSHGFSEMDIDGQGIILSDAALVYSNEAFYGDLIKVSIGINDYSKYGCDLIYLLENSKSKIELCRVKTGIVFYNYKKKKVVNVPRVFKEKFLENN